MRQVAIYGTSTSSMILKNLIHNVYNPARERCGKEGMKVVSFVVEQQEAGKTEMGGYPIIDLFQFKSFCRMHLIEAMILTRENFYGQTLLISRLIQAGIDIDHIYLSDRLDWNILSDEHTTSFIESYWNAKYFPYLEFHIADHCNLNCKACEHYAGLVKAPHYPDFERFSNDMHRLHELIDDIGRIRILGGEPLLNPEVSKYVRLSRELYPKAEIIVVTNGLLLKSMSSEFFDVMRETGAGISVSAYPPMRDKLQDLYQFLLGQRIPFGISHMYNEFTIKQTLNRHDHPQEIFLNCFQAHCHNLYEGKIAACFLPFTTKYFNRYFQKELPEDGAIDLYDASLTTEILHKKLLFPFERCRYCKPPVSVKWDQIRTPSVLSDWVVE